MDHYWVTGMVNVGQIVSLIAGDCRRELAELRIENQLFKCSCLQDLYVCIRCKITLIPE